MNITVDELGKVLSEAITRHLLNGTSIGEETDLIPRVELDDSIRRMSIAFAEKVSSLEGHIRNLELDKDQASAVIDKLADTNHKQHVRIMAGQKMIRSLRTQLGNVRRACGVRPPRRSR